MKLTFCPVAQGPDLQLDVAGDVLYINGVELDFGPIPEGAVLPKEAVDCEWVWSDVTRKDGQIELTIRLPHGYNAPKERRFPEPIVITEDGTVDLPPFDSDVPQYTEEDMKLPTDLTLPGATE